MEDEDIYRIDKARVRASFGRAADSYDAAAILQKQVREEMLSRLDLVKISPKVILDAGCGTGAASRSLQKRFAQSQVVSLDFAYPMLKKSQNASLSGWLKTLLRGGTSHNLLCADIEALPLAEASVDLLWSNLAVQWCNDLDTALREFHRVLRAEGLLTFSTFGPDTLRELRTATQQNSQHTRVSRFIDMHDIGDALVRAGFSAPVLDVERFTLTYDDVKSVMQDLKSIGAHNATAGRARGLQGRGFLQKLAENYELFRVNGKLPATFEVVYAHAWKGNKMPDKGVSPITFTPRNK